MTNENNYKAIDLLDKVLEFVSMTPEKSQWSVSALKSNPPRQIRLKQIESLLNAFFKIDSKTSLIDEIKSFLSTKSKPSVQSFLNGDFIRQRKTSEFATTIKFIKVFLNNCNINFDEAKEIHTEELVLIFSKLVEYKRQLRSILTYNSGCLELSSIATQFSIHLTNSISENLVNQYDNLDKSLEILINPQGLSFTEDELISKYNYPTENIDDIDFNYI